MPNTPPAVRVAFERALALHAAVTEGAHADAQALALHASEDAMAALGLPAFEPYTAPNGVMVGFANRPVFSATQLTDTQRQVLTALVDRSELFRGTFPIPATAWSRRQWLGLTPPGPLWAPAPNGEPRYFDLRRRQLADPVGLEAELAALPVAERVPLLFELDLVMADFWGKQARLIQAVMGDVGPDLGPWAQDAAERLLAGVAKPERFNLEHGRSQLVFAALVAAGVPITPRYDALLRLHHPRPITLLDTWIAAIPEARREAAVLSALLHMSFVDERVRMAAQLLPRWPFAGLALYAEQNLKDCRAPKEVRRTLKEVAAAQPHIKVALANWKKSQPKPLTFKAVTVASLQELLPLDAQRAAQLEAAAGAYNGEVCTAADIVAGTCENDEKILPETVRYTRLAGPRGRPTIDLWELMGDSGTYFRADTTEVVATISQSSVDCDDERLSAGLQFALRGA